VPALRMSAYTATCAAAGTRVLVAAESSFSSATSELLLNGHRTIELLDKRLADVDVAPLAVAMAEAKKFDAVDLSYNDLGAGAADSLATLLKSDAVITSLDLSQNSMSEESIQGLCEALKANGTIRALSLSGNAIGGSGGMAVAEMLQVNSGLESLSLSNCGLNTESLVALATVLRDNTRLVALDVSRPLAVTIMDEPAAHFARMLKVNGSLVELDVSKFGLRDLGLKLIAEELYRAGGSSALQTLRMRCNKVELAEPDCVQALRNLLGSDVCRLSTLDLGGNRLEDTGAEMLAEMLGMNASLLELDVGWNGLMSRGLCAIAHNVRAHPKLRTLKLWGNHFDSAAGNKYISLPGMALDFKVHQVDGIYHCVEAR